MTELNLPELPEGYFFRVRQHAFGFYPWVELRRKLKWFGSVKVDEVWQYHTEFDSVNQEVEYLAGVLEDRIKERKRIYEDEYIEGDFT